MQINQCMKDGKIGQPGFGIHSTGPTALKKSRTNILLMYTTCKQKNPPQDCFLHRKLCSIKSPRRKWGILNRGSVMSSPNFHGRGIGLGQQSNNLKSSTQWILLVSKSTIKSFQTQNWTSLDRQNKHKNVHRTAGSRHPYFMAAGAKLPFLKSNFHKQRVHINHTYNQTINFQGIIFHGPQPRNINHLGPQPRNINHLKFIPLEIYTIYTLMHVCGHSKEMNASGHMQF